MNIALTLFLCGAAAIITGIWLISPVVALIAGGCFLIALSIVFATSVKK